MLKQSEKMNYQIQEKAGFILLKDQQKLTWKS
jgi:hypothetical protein